MPGSSCARIVRPEDESGIPTLRLLRGVMLHVYMVVRRWARFCSIMHAIASVHIHVHTLQTRSSPMSWNGRGIQGRFWSDYYKKVLSVWNIFRPSLSRILETISNLFKKRKTLVNLEIIGSLNVIFINGHVHATICSSFTTFIQPFPGKPFPSTSERTPNCQIFLKVALLEVVVPLPFAIPIKAKVIPRRPKSRGHNVTWYFPQTPSSPFSANDPPKSGRAINLMKCLFFRTWAPLMFSSAPS